MGFIELRAAAQQLLDQMLHDGVLMDPEHPRRVAVEDLRAALAEPAQEPQCNPHPKAPHGFLRNASHTEHRYVCECEGWEPYEAGYQAGMEAALSEPVPLTVTDLQQALIETNLIDPDAIDDPEHYDACSTLLQIDELYRKLTA